MGHLGAFSLRNNSRKGEKVCKMSNSDKHLHGGGDATHINQSEMQLSVCVRH